MNPENIVNLAQHPIQDVQYTQSCKAQIDSTGALVMENFLSADTVKSLQDEARKVRPLAFFLSAESQRLFIGFRRFFTGGSHPQSRTGQ